MAETTKTTAEKAKAVAPKAPKADVVKTEGKAPAKVSAPKVSAPKTEAVAKASAEKEVKTAPAKKEKVKKAPYVSSGEIKVELVHSTASCTKRQIKTVQALGLRKLHDVKTHKDNPAIRGMVGLVAHLVSVEKVK
jgi:large subunit ribosomal protein L30